MTSPVTVLLPVYNGQPFLAESIESILKQSFSNLELLIIDDASTDNSVETISKFHDSRIRLIRHQNNQGLISTLNHGLTEARHELIARHDQDDIAYPERLQYQTEYLSRNPDVGVCGSGAYLLVNGVRGGKIIFPASDCIIRWLMPFYSPLIHPSIMYRRSIVRLVNGYSVSPEADYAEDFDLWCKLITSTRFHNIQLPLMDLRKHQTNMTVSKQEYHIQQTTGVAKKYIDQLLNRDVPVELIRWLRGTPSHSLLNTGRSRLVFDIYTTFLRHNQISFFDFSKITVDTAFRMIKGLIPVRHA